MARINSRTQVGPYARRARRLVDKKSILEVTSQEPIICEFEGFIIRPFDGWHLWMESPGGDGTQIRKAEFLGTLSKLFEKNF